MKAIAKEDGIPGFPSHLRVLHVRQEIPVLNDDISVLQAVIDADVERKMLMEKEKELLAKLDSAGGAGNDEKLSVQAKREKLQQQNGKEANAAFDKDLKELDELYERLQGLGSDSAEARAAMILSGLQFSPDMQSSAISRYAQQNQMKGEPKL